MSHPGSFPGDPAGRQPDPATGAYEYPPTDAGVPLPPPPPGYSLPQQWPVPPPPYTYGPADPHAHPQYPPPRYPPGYGSQAPANGPAIGSLVSSLVAVPGYLLCFGFIGSILGVVLGIVALTQISKTGQRGRGMAIAGIVLGALGLVGMGLLSLLVASPSLWY